MAYNYIIASDDYSTANYKIEEIKKSIPLELDTIRYDLEEDGIYSLIDELLTVSLFDTTKLVIVKSAEELLKASEKAITELCKAMNNMQSENVLILLFLHGINANHERILKLKKYASWIDARIQNISLEDYIVRSMQEDGYTIDSQALALLSSYLDNLSAIQLAVDQLKCYKKEDKTITDQDVKTLIAPPLEDNVYQLVEAVLNHDKIRMFRIFDDLKLQSMQASYMVSLLINKFQELYNAYILVKGNMSTADLAELFHISSGRAYYMVKNARSSNITQIKRNLELLNDLDYKIKTGKIDQGLGLELFFLN